MLRKLMIILCMLALCGAAYAKVAYDELRTLDQGYQIFRAGDQWGLMDPQGDVILDAEYEILYLHSDGLIYAYKNGALYTAELEKAGEIDEASRNAEPAQEEISSYRAPQFGISGKPYDSISFTANGYGVARRKVEDASFYFSDNNRYGIVNADEELILPCHYTRIELDTDGSGAVFTNTNDSYRMAFRIEGDEVHFYHEVSNGNEILLPAWSGNWAKVIPLGSHPASYLAHTLTDDPIDAWVLVDADGNILEREYLHEIYDYGFEARGYTIANRNGLYGYLNYTGGFMVDPQFLNAEYFKGGRALVRDTNEKYGFIDESGAYIIQPKFDDLGEFKFGYARAAYKVMIEEESDDFSGGPSYAYYWGLIDTEGEVVLPLEYDELGEIADDGTVTAEKGGKSFIFALTPEGVEEVKTVVSSLSLEDYMPFTGSKVAKLSGEPTLANRADSSRRHPWLDGATALFPVYSAIVEAVYPDETRYKEETSSQPFITCTKTNRAYERLVEGTADIIFCAGPSDAQIEMAAAAGVEFELTPFGKEAFVFIVNQNNPLDNITVEQIQGIYSGKILEWEELGIEGIGDIVAYQRPENSGSQTALQRLMGDIPLMEAPKENIPSFMEDIIENVEYRNLANAIGYSFRFFCTEMAQGDVKLLSIDGVAPTLDNIRADTYPITSTLYMVTRKGEDNPNVHTLIEWVLSEQGQELVEKSGYVGYVEER